LDYMGRANNNKNYYYYYYYYYYYAALLSFGYFSNKTRSPSDMM